MQVSSQMPADVRRYLEDQADVFGVSKSHNMETRLRNGIAIYWKLKELDPVKNEPEYTAGFGVISTYFEKIEDRGDGIRLVGRRTLPADFEARIKEISKIFDKAGRERATFWLTSDMREFLVVFADRNNISISLSMFLFIQASIMLWEFSSSGMGEDMRVGSRDHATAGSSDGRMLSPEESERIGAFLDEMKDTFAKFEFDEMGTMHVGLERKTVIEKEKARPVSKVVEMMDLRSIKL